MTYERHIIGKEGEDEASLYLQKQGYKIIQRNFRCKQGEIDIIAKDKKEYVFIEVKTRQNFHYGAPSEAVDEQKQNHIWKVAEYYIYIHKLENAYIRFDVLEIYKNKSKFYIHHIKQAISL